jgi:uncharacterized protein YgiM (DUF1202 family)
MQCIVAKLISLMRKNLLSIGVCLAIALSSCGGGAKEEKKTDASKDDKKTEQTDKPEGEPKDKGESNAKSDESKAVVIAKSGLSMREEPESTSKMVTLLPANALVSIVEKGSEVTIKGKKAPWYKVKYGKKEGWAFGAYLRMGESVKATADAKAETAGDDATTQTSFDDVLQKGLVVANSGLTLRKEPNAKSASVIVAPKNAEVGITEFGADAETINGLDGVWYKVRYGKKEGYVFSAYLCISMATVNAKSGLTLRDQPDKKAKAITVIPSGKSVYMLPPPEGADGFVEDANGGVWYKVRYGKYEGWAFAEFLDVDMGC